MRLLTLAFLTLFPGIASAATPWFDQAAAEQVVAQAMPDYYEQLTQMQQVDPEKYQDRLHRALVMVVQAEVYPELLTLWNRKSATEARFRELVEEWRQASPSEQAAIRAEMLVTAEQLQEISQELFQFKLIQGQERLERLYLQIADLDANMDMIALERVMNALDEY